MDEDRQRQPLTDQAFAKMREDAVPGIRTEVTILFSDIKGSTAYFEQKGDVEGLAMIQRHNTLLFPVIEGAGGRVVKTIGDAIMACFKDPSAAVRAAVEMQQVLHSDRKTVLEDERIHVRVALHMGLGIEMDNDIFGDVVNATAKVQQQCDPDQILITDALLDAARQNGFQCAKLRRAQIKGKDEAIDLYAVAWSSSANEQLLEEVERQFEARLKEARRQKELLEEELEASREQWRTERRRLTEEIEELEGELEHTREAAGQTADEDLQAQIHFQLDQALAMKQQVEQELINAQARWEIERKRLRDQIDSLHGAALQAMEQTNNPARLALAVREQVDSRLKDAKVEWQLQWEAERRRLNAEIERLKKGGGEQQKDAARRAVLQRLGKLPAGQKGPMDIERDFDEAKAQWDLERDELKIRVNQLERQVAHNKDSIRQEVFQELRAQYEPKIEAYEHERKRLKDDLDAASAQLADERQRLMSRIDHLEQTIPEGQEAVRAQLTAELRADFERKLEEVKRIKARGERRAQEQTEEVQAALRRATKEVVRLQAELKDAREAAFRAQRGTRSGLAATPNS
jgi:class 3 adenylate cyclase